MTQLPAFSGLTGVGTFVTFANHAARLRWPHMRYLHLVSTYYNVNYNFHGGIETARHKPGQADAGKTPSRTGT
jgi:hypothetical protein